MQGGGPVLANQNPTRVLISGQGAERRVNQSAGQLSHQGHEQIMLDGEISGGDSEGYNVSALNPDGTQYAAYTNVQTKPIGATFQTGEKIVLVIPQREGEPPFILATGGSSSIGDQFTTVIPFFTQ